ncbi:MAG TPA: DUF6067 family protein [Candidatus Brocadiia bacterium]|nr:DUF6067 family protein [Candidatus Brocadiia bacterium]
MILARTIIPVMVILIASAVLSAPFSRAGSLEDDWIPITIACSLGDDAAGSFDPESPAWKSAASACFFHDISSRKVDPIQPTVLVGRLKDALIIQAFMPLPEGAKPKADARGRDGNVWDDDAFEVFIDPGHSHSIYYQFIVNAAGAKWDSRGKDGSWSVEWDAKTEIRMGGWAALLRIPYASLGKEPTDGDLWGFNAAWDRQTPRQGVFAWVSVLETLHEPGRFGHLLFTSGALPCSVAGAPLLKDDRLEIPARAPRNSTVRMTVSELSSGKPAKNIIETEAKTVADEPIRFSVEWPKANGFRMTGDFLAAVAVSDQARKIFWRAVAPISVPEPLNVRLKTLALRQAALLEIDATGIGIPLPAGDCVVEFRPKEGGKPTLSRKVDLGNTGMADIEIGTAELAPGDYIANVAFISGDKTIFNKEIPFITTGKPEWLGSKQGFTDKVLPPWTPIEVAGRTVKVSGRSYEFAGLPGPAKVTIGSAEILAGPIEFRVVSGGVEQKFTKTAVECMEKSETKAVLKSEASGEDCSILSKTTVEFDGLIRSDFRLDAKGKAIDSFRMDVPIRKEYANYLYHFPGKWNSSFNVGAFPDRDTAFPFKPYVWIGDEERGFSWFCESDRNFNPADRNEVTRIIHENDIVILSINVISSRAETAKPIEFTFGFQATPVKTPDKDVWDYRICHAGNYGIQDQPYAPSGRIIYPAEGNINFGQGTLEVWVRNNFDSDVPIEEPGNKGALNRDLFTVVFPNDDRIGLYWNIDDRGMRVYSREGGAYPIIVGTASKWKPGEWHHVALTWGTTIGVWVDGKRLGSKLHTGSVSSDPRGAELVFDVKPGHFDVDAIRISDVPRLKFDVTKPPEADEHTLLLDQLDERFKPDGKLQTMPMKGISGLVTGQIEFAKGRFGNCLASKAGSGKMSYLDHLASIGVRTICFHEHWTDIQNYTSTTHGEKLKALVKACHERNIQVLPYFGYEISNIAPEWPLYNEECLTYPRAGGYHRQPEQNAYIVCYRSAWQDFMAHGIARMMDEYDIDGVYLDGTANPWQCANRLHGCGYEKPNGGIEAGYAIFPAREMMRRIYTIVKTRKADGQVNVHQSTCMTTPSIAFATSYWDGEQFGSIPRGADVFQLIPLDAFRCEFMGHQWGIPAEFLCYDRPYTMREAMSFTLLHDVLTRNTYDMSPQLWKAMDEFGRREAHWLPYWKNEALVKTDSPETKVSLYLRKGKGCIAVISNLGKGAHNAEARFDLAAMGLPENVAGTEVISGEMIALPGGVFNMELQPLDFRVVWIK